MPTIDGQRSGEHRSYVGVASITHFFWQTDRESAPSASYYRKRIVKALDLLVRGGWLVRAVHHPQSKRPRYLYRQSDELERRIEAMRPIAEEESKEKRLQRLRKKQAYWLELREAQNGKCCLCDADLPEAMPIEKDGWGYSIAARPYIRTIREIGDVVPCGKCFGRLTHVTTAEQYEREKRYWSIVDQVRKDRPSLVPKNYVCRILGIRSQVLEHLVALGLPCETIAGELFFEQAVLDEQAAQNKHFGLPRVPKPPDYIN